MQEETIIGIDLGTTNSEVAVIEDGRPRVITENGSPILPSVVGLTEDGRLIIGDPARNQELLAPDRTIRSVKRRMGEDVKLPLGDQRFTPQEVSAMILRELKTRAERDTGHSASKAVITVPAYFNDAQRQATRDAGELAGLDVVRIINEPTAASLVYEAGTTDAEQILVYDLGGGTFDVSIVRIEKGVVEVLASHGDTHLGGDDFDQLLVDHVAERFQEQHGLDLREDVRWQTCLQRAVEQAKIRLSTEPYARIDEEFIAERAGNPLHLSMELERHVYEDMIRPLIEKTMASVQNALSDAGILAQDLDRIVLAGGCTRTPLIREELQRRTGKEPHLEIDPDLCVGMGAAIQAGIISGQQVGAVLVDVAPRALGISYLGEKDGRPYPHCYSPIIHKNTSLPASRSDVYYTSYDNQETVEVRVYQGEDSDALKNTEIGKFRVTGLSRGPANNPVTCRLDLDLNGMLKVTATEKRTRLEKHIIVDNALSRFEAEEMSAASKRLRVLFGDSDDGQPLSEDRGPAADKDCPVDPRRAQAHATIEQARDMLGDIPPEDQEVMGNLIQRARDSLEDGQLDQAEGAARELEDIMFYLENA